MVGLDLMLMQVIYPGLLEAIILKSVGAIKGGARNQTKCEAELSRCSLVITALWGVGLDPKFLEQEL